MWQRTQDCNVLLKIRSLWWLGWGLGGLVEHTKWQRAVVQLWLEDKFKCLSVDGMSIKMKGLFLQQVFPMLCFHRCAQATLPWPSLRLGSQKIHRISAVVQMTVAKWCTLGPFPTIVCVISGTFLFAGLHGCYKSVCVCMWVCLSEHNSVCICIEAYKP